MLEAMLDSPGEGRAVRTSCTSSSWRRCSRAFLRPGALELLAALRAAGVRLGVASNSRRVFVEHVLRGRESRRSASTRSSPRRTPQGPSPRRTSSQACAPLGAEPSARPRWRTPRPGWRRRAPPAFSWWRSRTSPIRLEGASLQAALASRPAGGPRARPGGGGLRAQHRSQPRARPEVPGLARGHEAGVASLGRVGELVGGALELELLAACPQVQHRGLERRLDERAAGKLEERPGARAVANVQVAAERHGRRAAGHDRSGERLAVEQILGVGQLSRSQDVLAREEREVARQQHEVLAPGRERRRPCEPAAIHRPARHPRAGEPQAAGHRNRAPTRQLGAAAPASRRRALGRRPSWFPPPDASAGPGEHAQDTLQARRGRRRARDRRARAGAPRAHGRTSSRAARRRASTPAKS